MTSRSAFVALLFLLLLPGVPAVAQVPAEREPVPVAVYSVPLQGRDGGEVRTVTSPEPFSMAGISWSGPAPEVMELRVRQGEDWSPWTAVGPADGLEEHASASEPVWTGPSHELQIRALREGVPAQEVTAVLLDPGSSPDDLVLPVIGRTELPPVITRAGWGADESTRCREPSYDDAVQAVTLHHTAGSNNYGPEDSAAIVRGIYTYHARTLGWCDIGYHALVDRYGQVFEGRAGGLELPVIGAHAGGFNRRTSSIAMMGLYTGLEPPEALRAALTQYLDWKLELHGLDPHGEVTLVSEGGGTSRYPRGTEVRVPVLFGHRDVGNTECPGDDGYALLPMLRAAAATEPVSVPVPVLEPEPVLTIRTIVRELMRDHPRHLAR